MSKSHFLDAPYYVNQVNNRVGIRNPDARLDDQWFYVEPKTGVVFRSYLAYQATLGVFPLFNRSNQPFGNITQQMVPYYVVMQDIDGKHTIIQYDELNKTSNSNQGHRLVIDISVYGGITMAVVCCVVALALAYQRKIKKRKNESVRGDVLLDLNKHDKQSESAYDTIHPAI